MSTVAGPPGAVDPSLGVVVPEFGRTPPPPPPFLGSPAIESVSPPPDVLEEIRSASAFFSSGFSSGSRVVSSLVWDVRWSKQRWSRSLPFPQCTFRFDGKNVRDGAGLGSPAFWFPARFSFLDSAAPLRAVLDSAVREAGFSSFLSNFALDINVASPEVRSTLFSELRAKSEASAQILLEKIKSELPDLMLPEIPDGQPFRLDMIAAICRSMNDLDADFPLRGHLGWHLGSEIPIDDSGLWPLKSLKKSESPFEERCNLSYQLWSENYRSFSEFFDMASEKVQSDVVLGFAEKPGTWSQLCERVGLSPDTPTPSETSKKGLLSGPADFAAARLGAVPQGDSVRVVVDGTIGGVNPRCILPETQQTPGLADVLSGLDPDLPTWYALKIDVKSAYKRLKLVRSDWRRAIFSIGGEWYFYKVLPFGLKASGYWWNRFNSLIHRTIHRLLSDVAHGGFVYVDDSLWLVAPDVAPMIFARVFTFLSLIGVPLSWEKTQIGYIVDWVGFEVDFRNRRVSLNDLKRSKLSNLLDESFSGKSVHINVLQTVGGFMSWASTLVPTARPLLWPIFRAIYAASAHPDQRVYDMSMIRATTRLWRHIILTADTFVPRNLRQRSPALLRVDACADEKGAWLGGWFLERADAPFSSIKWFACSVPVSIFPDRKKREQSFISACEMLALALAVRLWGSRIVANGFDLARLQSDSMVSVLSCGADYAKSPNMAFALRELVVSELSVGLETEVQHIPGISNVLADAISRRFNWIWKVLPPSSQEHIGLSDLIPFALSCIDSETHDPYVGVVVGNAKNPGPGSRSDISAQLKRVGYTDEVISGFFALFPSDLCDKMDHASTIYLSEVLGCWRADAPMPFATFRSLAQHVFAWETKAKQAAFWENFNAQSNAVLVPLVENQIPSSRGGRLRPSPSGFGIPPPTNPVKRKLSPASRSRQIAREATTYGGSAQTSFVSTASRTSEQKAKAMKLAASAVSLRNTIDELKHAYFADATWRSHASEVRLYVELCEQAQIRPWPVSYNSMVSFVAILTACEYKSVSQYVVAVQRQQALSGLVSSQEDRFRLGPELPMMLRAARRDKGEPHHVEAITERHLLKIRLSVSSTRERFVWDLMVLEWFFLLRSAEALALSPDAITFLAEGQVALPGSVAAREMGIKSYPASMVVRSLFTKDSARRFRVRVRIKKDKTNQQGKDVHRFLDCVCTEIQLGTASPPFCPVHCAARLCERHSGPATSHFTSGIGTSSLEPSAYLSMLRHMISVAGFERFEILDGEQTERFGTHSLRRGGAQALAMAGWSMDNIKFFGRWLSSAVEVYLLDIPFRVRGHLLAKSMVSSWNGAGERDSIFPSVKPCVPKLPARGDRLRISLPVDPSSEDTPASGWYDALVVGTQGFVFNTLDKLVSKLTILDSDLRATNLVPPDLPGSCAEGWIIVRPFPLFEQSPALYFELSSIEWIRS